MVTDHSDGKTYFAEERKQKIVEIIGKSKKIIVPELCRLFNVSASTIRNDLKELEKLNLIMRTHGGAMQKSKVNLEPLPIEKESQMLSQKEAIAVAASNLVEDGDTIAISTGTTTFEFAKKLLKKSKLTILLNDIHIASFFEKNSDFTLFIVGGIIRKGFHYINCTGTPLPNVSIDKIFFSCNGITLAKGATVPDFHLANDVKSLIGLASEVILLSDSSKLGTISFAQIAPIDEIDYIITDDSENEEILEELREQNNSKVIVASMKKDSNEELPV